MIRYRLLADGPPDAVFARRAGQAITVRTFLNDAATLAATLPAMRHVANLCCDRYRFTVGLAAALTRGQISLLPPNDTPELLAELAADYQDLHCLTDEMVAPSANLGPIEVPDFPASQPAVVLFTSGSTGRPQPHPRNWGTLVRSARAAGKRLGIAAYPGAALLGTVPHQHSYGLESLVMLALQYRLVMHTERLFYPEDIRTELALAPSPRLLVTTPIHLRVLLSEPTELPPADLVLSATAPLSPQLARQAEARFTAPLFEIYGCSEAGQLAARRTTKTAEWRCLDGIKLTQDETGTRAAGIPVASTLPLNDVLELRSETRFILHGRLADLVNVAGKRTSLAHLTHHLNAIEGVQDGIFVALDPKTEDTVTRLAAFAVAPTLTADAILGALRKRIDAAFLPRPLHLVEELPRNALGKLPQAALPQLLAQAAGS